MWDSDPNKQFAVAPTSWPEIHLCDTRHFVPEKIFFINDVERTWKAEIRTAKVLTLG